MTVLFISIPRTTNKPRKAKITACMTTGSGPVPTSASGKIMAPCFAPLILPGRVATPRPAMLMPIMSLPAKMPAVKPNSIFTLRLKAARPAALLVFRLAWRCGDSPKGPFTDPRGMPMILLEDTAKDKQHSWRNIDPAVFVDDDGRAYLYWGNQQLWWAELEPDLVHLKGEKYQLDAKGRMQNRDSSQVNINKVTTLPNFEEGPHLSKHHGIYYLVYAAGFPESLAYATSNSATGPWQYRGVIMDPLPGTTTIHPALFDFNGQTYLAYHNADLPGGGNYRRSVALDRVFFNPDGSIQPIIRTRKP